MQDFTIGKIDKLIIHFIGNKNNGDGVRLSDELTDFENIEEQIKGLMSSNLKTEELYHFFFLPKLELNPMYLFIKEIFDNQNTFIEQSKNAGRYLYDKSTHPQIKSGELCVILLSNCQLNDKVVNCIGLFKSENKDTVLKIDTVKNGYGLTEVIGINTRKLDKGCIIFNTEKENGYLISVIDNTNKNVEAQYWKDDFLSIKPIKNEYQHTTHFLGITRQFVTNRLDEEFELSKADQIDFLNRSVDYFKKNKTFNKNEFEETVFGDDDLIDSFRKFDTSFRKDNKIELADNFEISHQAVKKQSRVFKSVLKLDKNFHIYIHGNRELIEQGIDEEGRKFYKIFYEEEN
ncbi:nucleoid-associated protein [Flavobacterium covae]|uniref:nucleoid-associated protein n=1 Tax=Flavobacterium covae TaxID=2906076 RepID=UPI0035E44039